MRHCYCLNSDQRKESAIGALCFHENPPVTGHSWYVRGFPDDLLLYASTPSPGMQFCFSVSPTPWHPNSLAAFQAAPCVVSFPGDRPWYCHFDSWVAYFLKFWLIRRSRQTTFLIETWFQASRKWGIFFTLTKVQESDIYLP